MSFAEYMKNRTQRFESMRNKLKSESNKQWENDDDRLWYPNADKAGNGTAVIRFLDCPKYHLPFVRVFTHAYQGPTGSWLIENCPTTLEKKCPICEHNSTLWNSGFEHDKNLARKQKRKVHYYSNIYIINDPQNPEFNGQVKIFRYGRKIYDMLNAMQFPEFADVKPVNPFDMMEGATFRLRFKKGEGGWRNYDHSSFDSPGALYDDENKLKEIFEQLYDLTEFIQENEFKGYDALKARLDLVTGKGKKASEEELPFDADDDDPLMDKIEKVAEDTKVTDFDELFESLKND